MINEVNKQILSDITVHMKYAKYIPELNRRETWKELVDRNKEMHIRKYPDLETDIKEYLKHVTLYKPQNQKDCDEVIRLILNKN